MSEWLWVALGFGIAYVALAVYFASLHRRWRTLRRKEQEFS